MQKSETFLYFFENLKILLANYKKFLWFIDLENFLSQDIKILLP